MTQEQYDNLWIVYRTFCEERGPVNILTNLDSMTQFLSWLSSRIHE